MSVPPSAVPDPSDGREVEDYQWAEFNLPSDLVTIGPADIRAEAIWSQPSGPVAN
ncbi:MAG: hypothetical protein ABI831_22885 [Betaproteobacteria bacterium]